MTVREPRLHVEPPVAAHAELSLHDAPAHYARNVLRLGEGARLRVFDGQGNEFMATLARMGRHALHIIVGERIDSGTDSPLAVHLGIGLARGERMDWTIQKCTELGVTTITPLLLARCTAKLGQERSGNRLRHWRQVAISACEQCGRNRLPSIAEPVVLDRWLDADRGIPGLVLHTADGKVLSPGAAPTAIRVLIGPEGGLEQHEFERARAAGFMPWSLGPRVLRTETAPVAALAILQYLWGDLGAR